MSTRSMLIKDFPHRNPHKYLFIKVKFMPISTCLKTKKTKACWLLAFSDKNSFFQFWPNILSACNQASFWQTSLPMHNDIDHDEDHDDDHVNGEERHDDYKMDDTLKP